MSNFVVRLQQSLPALLVGAISAMFLLVGRWSPARLGIELLGDSVWLEPRVLAIGVMAALALSLRKVPAREKAPLWFALLATFLLYLACSALWSTRPIAAAEKAFDLGLLLGMLALIHFALQRLDVKFVCDAFFVSLLLLLSSLCVAALLSLDADSLAINRGHNLPVLVLGSGPNIVGRNMALLVLAFLFARHFLLRWLSLLLVPAGALLLLLSGSRGALLELLVPGLATTVLLPRGWWWKLLVAALAASPMFLCSGPGEAARSVVESRVVGRTFVELDDSGRQFIWSTALDEAWNAPVFGNGLGAFHLESRYNQLPDIRYPHNLFLEALHAGGLFGLALLVAALVAFLRQNLVRAFRHWSFVHAALLLMSIFVMLSGDLFDARGFFLLMLFAHVHGGTRRGSETPLYPATP